MGIQPDLTICLQCTGWQRAWGQESHYSHFAHNYTEPYQIAPEKIQMSDIFMQAKFFLKGFSASLYNIGRCEHAGGASDGASSS